MSFIPENFLEAEKEDIKKLDAFLNREESSNDSDTSLDDEDDFVIDESENDRININPNSNINIEFNDVTPYTEQVQTILSKINTINLDTVLLLNTAQQNLLKEAIAKHQKLLQNCDEQLNRIRIMRKELTAKAGDSKMSSWFRCGVPYFKDKSSRHYCPSNSDVHKKIKNGEIALIDLPPCRFWLTHEKEILKKAVCAQSKQIRLKMLIEKSQNQENSENQESIEQLKKKPAEECVFPVYDKNVLIDWLKISIHDLKGRHTDEACKAMWYQYLHPHLNNKPFGPREVQKLKEIAKKHNFQNWDVIAEELGTNRSGYSCCLFNRVNQDKDKKLLKWTSEEDNKLITLVEKFKIGNFIPWGRIAHSFPNRDKSQVYNRYNTSLKAELRKGKFSKQEDLLLVTLAKKYGDNIKKISSYFKGRTVSQIRVRYTSLVTNGNKMKRWTEEEDKKIIEFVKENYKPDQSISWSQLEKILNNPFRNRTNIRHRWSTIKNYLNSSFEGDLSKIPRPQKKRQCAREFKQVHLDKMMTMLDNDNTKISDLTDISKEVLSAECQRKMIDVYENFFIQKFAKTRFDEPLEILEIDVVNSLFLINLLQGGICLESLYHKRFKKNNYTEINEVKIVEFLRNIVETMNENGDETVINYLRNTYLLPQSTEHATIDLIIPSCFISMNQIDRMIAIIKPFLKHVLWYDSELDQFYHKATGRLERNLKCHIFQNENSLDNLEKSIVSSAKSITCNNFLECKTARRYKSVKVTEIFKMRYLALFNFQSMESIVSQIMNFPEVKKIENVTRRKKKQPQELKRGRPRKRLPGGKYKYSKEEDEEGTCSNQKKSLTENINEELMSESSQDDMENDEVEPVLQKIKFI